MNKVDYFYKKNMRTMDTVMQPFSPDGGDDVRHVEVRAWRKSDFAQLYFPDLSPRCALRKLNRWISHSKEFRKELYGGPEGTHDAYFSRRQVRLLLRHFDEP